MTYKLDSRFIGYPPIEPFLPTVAVATAAGTGFAAANAYPPVTPGTIVRRKTRCGASASSCSRKRTAPSPSVPSAPSRLSGTPRLAP
jgi:hypothetical protein